MSGTPDAPPPAAPPQPSVNRMKTFILETAGILDRKTKLTILALVKMEFDPDTLGIATDSSGPTKCVNINLDLIAETNLEVLRQIYNLVCAYRTFLNQPASASDL